MIEILYIFGIIVLYIFIGCLIFNLSYKYGNTWESERYIITIFWLPLIIYNILKAVANFIVYGKLKGDK